MNGTNIHNIIRKKLDEIERVENVRILHCVESGSRAWGFASPDSDYDVRFVYVRPKEFYLRLDKTRDVIEWQLDDTLDINGWDIKKALRLLHASNPTLFEWGRSPIVYRTTEEWRSIAEIMDGAFDLKSSLYHYASTAKKHYALYVKEDKVRYKKYFYMLRPILACKWILDRKTPPPMLFSELADAYLEEWMRPSVQHLLDIKMNASESEYCKPIGILNEYIESQLEWISEESAKIERKQEFSWSELNALFASLVC